MSEIQGLRLSHASGRLKLYDPKVISSQFAARGMSTDHFYGFTNSFTYRPRGPLPSEGFFLVSREDLERLAPSVFSESRSFTTAGYDLLLSSSATSSFSVTPFGVEETTTDGKSPRYQGLYPANIYSVLGSDKPSGYETFHDRSAFLTDTSSSDWSFAKQLYVLHLADKRYWLNQKKLSVTTLGDGPFSCKVPRPFSVGSEDLSQTNQTDTLDYENLKSSSSQISSWDDFWNELLHSGASNFLVGNFYPTLHSDLPTSFGNIVEQEFSNWFIAWNILDELAHTLVFDPSFYTAYIYPKGDTTGTTLATERSNYSKYLLEKSNDGSMSLVPTYYQVNFPYNQPGTGIVTGRTDYSVHSHNVDVSSLGITYTSNEIQNSMVTNLKGRIVHRKYDGVTYNNAQTETHAEELAKLHFKKDLWEHRNCFTREVYSGVRPFSATKDLASVTFINAADGWKTIISSPPFDRDTEDTLPIPKLKKDNSVIIPDLSQKLPSQFWKTYIFQDLLSQSGGGELSGTITHTTTNIQHVLRGAKDSSNNTDIEIYIDSQGSIPSGNTALVYWNHEMGRWETRTEYYEASSSANDHRHYDV